MLERGFLCDMALQWSLSTSSSSSRRRSSVAITPLCCFVSSQIAGHGWKLEWVQEWFWVESCSNKVQGRLPDCCNPTLTWPADQQSYPRVRSTAPTPAVLLWHTQERNSWLRCILHMCATGSSQLQPKVADLRGTRATAWWVVNVGLGEEGLRVCPRSPLPWSTLAGGCVFVLMCLRVELSSCFHGLPGCRGYCQL